MSIKNIRMYKVGFGDCFVVTDDNRRIMVDAGSTAPCAHNHIPVSISEDISNLEKNIEIDGVLSHFHQDHYSLIPGIKYCLFDNFYFPNFIFKKDIQKLMFIFIQVRTDSSEYKIAYSYLSLSGVISKMKRNGLIHFVSAESSLFIKDYRVLWPIKRIPLVNESVDKELYRIDPKLAEETDQLASRYCELFHESSFRAEGEERLEAILEELRQLHDMYDGNNTPINQQLIKDFSKWQNQISLVFDNAPMADPKKCLFLGDITPGKIREIISRNTIPDDFYSCIKVQHHGTNGSFSKTLVSRFPNAKYLISNTEDYRDWLIAGAYQAVKVTSTSIKKNKPSKDYMDVLV